MWKMMKLTGGIFGLFSLMILMACGPQFEEIFDADEQLAIDIELIEDYIAAKGYTDYDTLDNDLRALVLDVGAGEPIEPLDIISFHYVGIFLNDTIFDTSIKQLAYDQDLANIIDTTYQKNDDGSIKLDDEGNKLVSSINYTPGYFPIYFSTRNYTTTKTTHTTSGWATQQALAGTVAGYPPAVNYALFNCNIGGRALVFLPSGQAYGDNRNPSFKRFRNRVLMFEIRPVFKR
jgi:hypothetical protein